jgi:hypothetical protein
MSAGERLGELGVVGDREQVHCRHVQPAAPDARERGVAHARLSRPPRPRHHKIGAVLQRRSHLCDVLVPADHLAGRDRLVGGEQIAACLTMLGLYTSHVSIVYV